MMPSVCKWGWLFQKSTENSLWRELISIKYKGRTQGKLSPFWKDVVPMLSFLRIGNKKLVSSGKKYFILA